MYLLKHTKINYILSLLVLAVVLFSCEKEDGITPYIEVTDSVSSATVGEGQRFGDDSSSDENGEDIKQETGDSNGGGNAGGGPTVIGGDDNEDDDDGDNSIGGGLGGNGSASGDNGN